MTDYGDGAKHRFHADGTGSHMGGEPKSAGGCSSLIDILFWSLLAVAVATHLLFTWLWWAVPPVVVLAVPLGTAVWRWIIGGQVGSDGGGTRERRDDRTDLIGPDPEDRMMIVSIAVWGWWAVSIVLGIAVVALGGGDARSLARGRPEYVPFASLPLLAVLVVRLVVGWKERQARRCGILRRRSNLPGDSGTQGPGEHGAPGAAAR